MESTKERGKKLLIFSICFCILCFSAITLRGTDVSAAGLTENEDVLDMTNVTLSAASVECYLVPTYSYGDTVYYDGSAKFDIAVNSPVILNENMEGVNLTCKSSNKKVQADAALSDNVLHVTVYGNKKCTTKLTVGIGGKNFQIKVALKQVKIAANSLLLEKGKTKKLKLTGCSKGITWSSSNKKIATVSKDGVVKGKKTGNVVITAKIGGKRIGCAVSVTTKKLKKVCERATYIGTHWKYSQAKRTQNGYYDCSALVWKAYKECAGVTFGNAGYPGTTRTESAWCRDNKRMIKGGYTYKKVQKMQLNPGDIVFKSNNLKNPYNTTYHVEMFTGYACTGYDSKGKPKVAPMWASRGAGYSAVDGSLLARPMK